MRKFIGALPTGRRGEPGGLRGALQRFDRSATRCAAAPRDPQRRFPNNVVYDTKCEGFCCKDPTKTDHDTFFKSLLRAQETCCKRVHKVAAQAGRLQAMFVFEVSEDDAEDGSIERTFFFSLSSALGASGGQHIRLVWTLCEHTGTEASIAPKASPFDGFLLRFGRSDFTEHAHVLTHPLAQQAQGPLLHMSEVDVAKLLTEEKGPNATISIGRLETCDVDFDTMLVKGIEKSFEPILVNLASGDVDMNRDIAGEQGELEDEEPAGGAWNGIPLLGGLVERSVGVSLNSLLGLGQRHFE